MGQTLGITMPIAAAGRYRPTLINPVSGQKRFRNTTTSETFIGWLDSQRYLQSNGPYNPNMVRADSLLETPLSNSTLQFEFIAPAPVNSPGPYIGMWNDSKKIADVIGVFRRGLGHGRAVRRAGPGHAGEKTEDRAH